MFLVYLAGSARRQLHTSSASAQPAALPARHLPRAVGYRPNQTGNREASAHLDSIPPGGLVRAIGLLVQKGQQRAQAVHRSAVGVGRGRACGAGGGASRRPTPASAPGQGAGGRCRPARPLCTVTTRASFLFPPRRSARPAGCEGMAADWEAFGGRRKQPGAHRQRLGPTRHHPASLRVQQGGHLQLAGHAARAAQLVPLVHNHPQPVHLHGRRRAGRQRRCPPAGWRCWWPPLAGQPSAGMAAVNQVVRSMTPAQA